MTSLERLLANYTGISPEKIGTIVQKAPASYKTYYIPKNNGGEREINHPSKETKSLQYALIEILFRKLDVHHIAKAYIRGKSSPAKKTAELHKDYDYNIRVDFENFFPSIKPKDLKLAIEKSDLSNNYDFSPKDYWVLKRICFRKTYLAKNQFGLAVGAPSSPIISNIVMLDLDKEIFQSSKKIDENSTLTRYADDIVFSTNQKGICEQFYNAFKENIEEFDNPDLSINKSKTAYMSKGTKRIIAGLIITNEGEISIGYNQKERIKRKVYKTSKGELDEEKIKSLKGYLAYIQDVEPDFYDKLIIKYGSEIIEEIMDYKKEQ